MFGPSGRHSLWCCGGGGALCSALRADTRSGAARVGVRCVRPSGPTLALVLRGWGCAVCGPSGRHSLWCCGGWGCAVFGPSGRHSLWCCGGGGALCAALRADTRSGAAGVGGCAVFGPSGRHSLALVLRGLGRLHASRVCSALRTGTREPKIALVRGGGRRIHDFTAHMTSCRPVRRRAWCWRPICRAMPRSWASGGWGGRSSIAGRPTRPLWIHLDRTRSRAQPVDAG